MGYAIGLCVADFRVRVGLSLLRLHATRRYACTHICRMTLYPSSAYRLCDLSFSLESCEQKSKGKSTMIA